MGGSMSMIAFVHHALRLKSCQDVLYHLNMTHGVTEWDSVAELIDRARQRVAESERDSTPSRWQREHSRSHATRTPRRARLQSIVARSPKQGALAGVSLATVVLVAFVVSARSASPSTGTTAIRSATDVTNVAHQSPTRSNPRTAQVSRAVPIPPSWRSRCRFAPSLVASAPAVTDAHVCRLRDGFTVELRTYRGVADTHRAVAIYTAGLHGDAPAACTTFRGRSARWAQRATPSIPSGIFGCGQSARGAEMVWSLDRVGVVARAIGTDRSVTAMFQWWNSESELVATL